MKHQHIKIVLALTVLIILMAVTAVFSQNGEPPAEMPEMLVTLLSLFAPIVIQFVGKHIKKELYRFWLSILFSVITAFVAALISGVTIANSIEFVTYAFAISSIAYKTFWKPLWFNRSKKLNAPATKY